MLSPCVSYYASLRDLRRLLSTQGFKRQKDGRWYHSNVGLAVVVWDPGNPVKERESHPFISGSADVLKFLQPAADSFRAAWLKTQGFGVESANGLT